MRTNAFFAVCCALAAIVPFAGRQTASTTESILFPGWPAEFESQALTELPLTERERQFIKDFPGRIARFSVQSETSSREILLRWVTHQTRTLHPSADCFRGSGFSIHPLPLTVDTAGNRWSNFEAQRGVEKLIVRERIYSANGGESWADVSSWYWEAMLSKAGTKSGYGWWAVTVAEHKKP